MRVFYMLVSPWETKYNGQMKYSLASKLSLNCVVTKNTNYVSCKESCNMWKHSLFMVSKSLWTNIRRLTVLIIKDNITEWCHKKNIQYLKPAEEWMTLNIKSSILLICIALIYVLQWLIHISQRHERLMTKLNVKNTERWLLCRG